MDHVDEVMDSSYDVELVTDCPNEDCKDDFGLPVKVQNAPDMDLRIAKARHKSSYFDLNAQIMQCPGCLKTCSHHNLVRNSLN